MKGETRPKLPEPHFFPNSSTWLPCKRQANLCAAFFAHTARRRAIQKRSRAVAPETPFIKKGIVSRETDTLPLPFSRRCHTSRQGKTKENKKKQMLPLRNIICYIRRRPAITTQENIAPVQHDPEKNGMRPLLTYGIGPPKEAVQILPL